MTKILSISGSLRRGSFNTALLRAMAAMAPDGTKISLARISEIPLYNSDADVDDGPDEVQVLKASIRKADGLLIATPEYNYGIPGPLKNAIDWVSRPAYKSVLSHKPIAVLGASPGAVGTARAQAHLKQVLSGTVSDLFPYPEVAVGHAHTRIEDGKIIDENTREVLQQMLDAYLVWISDRISSGGESR